ncbi:MAG: hypothetical protein PVSMB10_04030 [Pseudarthrobacter sp.]
MAERLLTGAVAPDFTLKASSGQDVSLASGRGARTIVYFYPAASTPGCTKQACDFRDNLASFTAAGYRVLGISPDPVKKLATFAANEDLSFPCCLTKGTTWPTPMRLGAKRRTTDGPTRD